MIILREIIIAAAAAAMTRPVKSYTAAVKQANPQVMRSAPLACRAAACIYFISHAAVLRYRLFAHRQVLLAYINAKFEAIQPKISGDSTGNVSKLLKNS